MEISRSEFKKNTRLLLGAVAEDLLSTVVPGTNTAKQLFKRMQPEWTSPNHYLRWDDTFAMLAFYHDEQGRCLRFSYDNRKFFIPQVMELSNRENTIPVANIRLKSNSNHFNIDNELLALSNRPFKLYKRFLKSRGKKYYNGQLLRLKDLHSSESKVELVVQPVFYEQVCRTNLILDAKEKGIGRSIRETVSPDGSLEPLINSRLANSLGMNFLLFTADGRAVMPKRSRRVIVRSGQLSPSFSGVMEYTDSGSIKVHQNVLIREGFEEINLLEQHLLKDSIRFLGISRELIRGGKPEMFFTARTSLSVEDFKRMHKTALDRYEFTHPRYWVFWDFGNSALSETLTPNDSYSLRRAFERLLQKHGAEISVPLLTNLVLWLGQQLGDEFSGQ